MIILIDNNDNHIDDGDDWWMM